MINIQAVCKKFGSFIALDNIDLDIKKGEFLALLGPSGSGKTTLLRMIAGLEHPDSGSLLMQGQSLNEESIQSRKVGFVFQHYALFKHMTVFENVAFGLQVKKKKPSKKEIEEKVHSLLNLVQLDFLHDRYPSQLSGGQRQRVALARALAIEPRVMLLDEPFSALDAKVRQELRTWLKRLHHQLQITSIFVTHDVEEALELADRVVIMNEGKIQQIGTPTQVYQEPSNKFVYQFLGHVNTLKSDSQIIYARPYELMISKTPPENDNFVEAFINSIHITGPLAKIELTDSKGHDLVVNLEPDRVSSLLLKEKDPVFVYPKENFKGFSDYSI